MNDFDSYVSMKLKSFSNEGGKILIVNRQIYINEGFLSFQKEEIYNSSN